MPPIDLHRKTKLEHALKILSDLGMPRAQLNERSALCLLALANVTPLSVWADAGSPLVGITPIMDWAKKHYDRAYAPNTRETFRRQTMHQFMEAGICLYNPDNPKRAVNSPHAVYQIAPAMLELVKLYGTKQYAPALTAYLELVGSLSEQYRRVREMALVPVVFQGKEFKLSSGDHSQLIASIVQDFAPRFCPGADLVYVGDTGDKHETFNVALLKTLGVVLDSHGKLPDVVLYCADKNWLVLVESVTSHGPMDSKRHGELAKLFKGSTAGLVYVSAFPDRKTFLNFVSQIAWETEVWLASEPSHMIHFNGERFLGPYGNEK